MARQIILNLSTHYILSKVSEEDIFEKYVCRVEYDQLIRNPMRKDNDPTARFYINSKNRLIFHDFNGFFHGDCFAAVQKIYNLGFTETLYKIAGDFKILDNNTKYKRVNNNIERKQKTPSKISIKIQEWTETDKKYWKSYYLNSKILDKYKVFSVSKVWLNDNLNYTYQDSDPAYAYYFGNGFYKIYFPFRNEYRFLTNCNNYIIQGYEQLPEKYDFLIITKSLKDVLVADLLNIPSIAPQAESNSLPEDIINILKKRFPIILSNYDFDYTGIKFANKVRKTFNIQPVFLTNGKLGTIDFGSKDIAEYIQKNGLEKTKELIRDLYNNYLI